LLVLLEKIGQSTAKRSLSLSDKTQKSKKHVRKVTSETQNTDMMEGLSFEISSQSVTIPLLLKAVRIISLPWADTQTLGSTQPPTTRNQTAVTES
jgi:hypothetical protein